MSLKTLKPKTLSYMLTILTKNLCVYSHEIYGKALEHSEVLIHKTIKTLIHSEVPTRGNKNMPALFLQA